MKFIFFLFNLLFISYLSAGMNNDPNRIISSINKKLDLKITSQFPIIFSYDVRRWDNGVQLVGLSYRTVGPLSKNKIREIIVKSIEIILFEVNSDVYIRPFLAVYPFPLERIEFNLFLKAPDGGKIVYPHISVGGFIHNEITYSYQDQEPWTPYKEETVESYEEAKRIVEENKGK